MRRKYRISSGCSEPEKTAHRPAERGDKGITTTGVCGKAHACSGWRQSIVATLKANAAGIRFDFYALAQRTGEKQLFIINSSVFRLYVPQLPVYPVIRHRINLFQCQNLAAYAATDFDAQKQIPLRCICFLRGSRPRKNGF
jgi:hypothetical protein